MNEDQEGQAGDSHRARTPQVLLVEDDAVSASFLSEAIATLPAHVAVATTLAEALRLAATRTFDLWLIDAHLPDGSGIELLERLRAQGRETAAIAHTAETAKPVLDALIDAGFEEVLIKPLGVDAVQGAVRRFVGWADDVPHDAHSPASHSSSGDEGERPTCGKLPLWDDAAALRALNGNHAHVAAMRGLFRTELPQQAERIVSALRDNDDARLYAELHKLIASANFVGAARLAQNARDVQNRPDFERARLQLKGTLRDTLDSYEE